MNQFKYYLMKTLKLIIFPSLLNNKFPFKINFLLNVQLMNDTIKFYYLSYNKFAFKIHFLINIQLMNLNVI